MKKSALSLFSLLLLCTGSLNAEVAANENLVQGLLYLEQKSYQSAIGSFNAALKETPKNPFLWERRGYAFFCLKEYYQAINDFTLAILLFPTNGPFYVQRALAYHETGNPNAMKHDLIQAAQLGETHAQEFLQENNITW